MHRHDQLHPLKVFKRLARVEVHKESAQKTRDGQVQENGLRTLQGYFPLQSNMEQPNNRHS